MNFRSPQSYRLDNNNFFNSPNTNIFDSLQKTEPSFEKTPVLRPKTPYPEKSSEVMQFIEEKMRERLDISDKELETLNTIIVVQKNEMILSSFEVFQSNRDEEDFVDTIKRILSKIRGQNIERKQEKLPKEISGKASYFVSQRPATAFEEKKSEEFRPKSQKVEQKIMESKPKIQERPKTEESKQRSENPKPRFEDPKQRIEQPKQRTEEPKQRQEEPKQNKPPKPQETRQKVPENNAGKKGNAPIAKKNMLDMIFKTFFEETEEDFEPIEVGFAKHLYEKGDSDLVNVLNTCETIPKAVVLIKQLAVKAYTDWLNSTFDEKQKDYILKNRNERSSEICSIIYVIFL